jgi:hypothetical protein
MRKTRYALRPEMRPAEVARERAAPAKVASATRRGRDGTIDEHDPAQDPVGREAASLLGRGAKWLDWS